MNEPDGGDGERKSGGRRAKCAAQPRGQERPPDNAEELSSSLTALRTNNAKWMSIGATQFAEAVARYCKLE